MEWEYECAICGHELPEPALIIVGKLAIATSACPGCGNVLTVSKEHS